jgi:hypothetical protein
LSCHHVGTAYLLQLFNQVIIKMASERTYAVLGPGVFHVIGVMGSSADPHSYGWVHEYAERCGCMPEHCAVAGCLGSPLVGGHVFIRDVDASYIAICVCCRMHNGQDFTVATPQQATDDDIWLETRITSLLGFSEPAEIAVQRASMLVRTARARASSDAAPLSDPDGSQYSPSAESEDAAKAAEASAEEDDVA